MIEKDNSDLPPYDAVLFEAQRTERANEFAKAVKNLTRFNMSSQEDAKDKWTRRGASYILSDNLEIDVMRQGYFAKPENSISSVRISTPWNEHYGIDGQRRRARISRYVILHVEHDTQLDSLKDLEKTLPEPSEVLKEAEEEWVREKQARDFERSIDSNYRPPELINARTVPYVEVKLKQGPNWRTERASTLTNSDAKLSNLAARRQAGEEAEPSEYSTQEHNKLMDLLVFIKITQIKPVELDDDIIET